MAKPVKMIKSMCFWIEPNRKYILDAEFHQENTHCIRKYPSPHPELFRQRSKQDPMTNITPSNTITHSTRFQENLYDILLAQLEDTDSQYISKLCKKTQEKAHRKARDAGTISKKVFEDTSNRIFNSRKSNRQSSADSDSNSNTPSLS